ncbi:uracil-DNA glycosylase [Litchfieldia alkalitelluris]|uniref:Uracil-DNA glycosylase n=2 Tax=Evansella alkalicola TaxID=745819 RepID=A0ABS6K0A2_9BACI|nr:MULTISPECIES: uracil-DNA glycosylase [Bacillaceae]MBU9724286.1 uracil-DNA glycosylase [Bacillus alkalicola]
MTISEINTDWQKYINREFQKSYFVELKEFLNKEYEEKLVFPAYKNIFHALNSTSYEDTKVVILGQDPYHGKGQAHGLSFSVQPGVKIPPSLRNIYKELHSDLGYEIPSHGYLQSWANEGVLLLNTVLTVQEGKAYSHQKKGWEEFTDAVIQELNNRSTPVVFILWGRHAQGKKSFITGEQHHIIESPHPSPLSANRGFFGSRPFSKTNSFLRSSGLKEVNWELPVKL